MYEIGEKIESWTVVGPLIKKRKNPRGFKRYQLCKCVCEREKLVYIGSQGIETKSCGCQRKNQLTHGMSDTAIYRTWIRMKQRCYDPNGTRYKDWGGRGIVVCDRWKHSFESFYADIGDIPGGRYSLERIDNDGNYEPDNCRWASPKEQARNTVRNRLLTHDERTLPLVEWAEITGLKRTTISQRIDAYGWSIEKALTTPARKQYDKCPLL